MTTPEPGYVEEYRELRAEIRLLLDRRNKNVQLVLFLTTAIVGVLPKLGGALLPLVAAAMVAFVWFDEVRRLRAIFRIGAYLEVCVEPNVAGFHYEIAAARHPIQTSFVERVIANGLFPAAFLLLFGMAFYRLTWPVQWQLILLDVVLFVLLFLTLESHHTSTSGRKEASDWWRRRPLAEA